MRTTIHILILLLGSWGWHTGYAAQQCATPDSTVLSSIVRIAGDDGSAGSGVVIAPNRVLTAAHVLNEAKTAYVGYNETFKEARMLLIDDENDLALLEVPTDDLPSLQPGTRDLRANDRVWAVGYPRAGDLTMTPGVLERDDGSTLHTSAEIDSGDSGGGLIGCQEGHHILAGMLRGYGAIKQDGEYIKIANYSASVAARNISEFILVSNILAANGTIDMR
ncbi:MAG TPA: serine protease [Gammaproteobacteria bacterium]|nr:serine protease [Gammaproteobacteria bacterium]